MIVRIDPPVSLPIEQLSATDVDALAMQLIDGQRRKVGAAYGYCSVCGLAVSRQNVWAAQKKGRPPRCRACARPHVGGRTKDPCVYLCSVCRLPLAGRAASAARRQAKLGRNYTCKSAGCQREARRLQVERTKKKLLPCFACGRPSTPASSTRARNGQVKRAVCAEPRCRARSAEIHRENQRAACSRPRETCFVCGGPADAVTSCQARYQRKKGRACRAYCEMHRPGIGRYSRTKGAA